MAQVLKVKEWQGASGNWYVADVDTWTGWRSIAEMLGKNEQEYKDMLINQYHACIDFSVTTLLLSYWEKEQYKYAHKFFLDVNRIARNKHWMVERTVWNHES